MRAESNRDELDKLIDMKAVDLAAEGAAFEAMHDLAEKLLIVMTLCRRHPPTNYMIKIDPKKTFEDILLYSINKMVNTINAKGEEGVRFAADITEKFRDKN